jgi:hypothetical protein
VRFIGIFVFCMVNLGKKLIMETLELMKFLSQQNECEYVTAGTLVMPTILAVIGFVVVYYITLFWHNEYCRSRDSWSDKGTEFYVPVIMLCAVGIGGPLMWLLPRWDLYFSCVM